MRQDAEPGRGVPVMTPSPIEFEDERDQLRSELEETRLRLAEAHKMASLGRLAAGIVHEINTPIGSIFSNNEVLQKSLERIRTLLGEAQRGGLPPPERAFALLDSVSSLASIDKLACERISSVIRSLKTFARVNEGDLRKVDLHELMRDMMKLSGCTFRRRVAIQTEFGDLPPVECYPALLSQVFLNLVVNAAQAIEGEGTITVRTREEGGWAHVSITDTGCGIRPENRPKIFRAGFTTKPLGEGTGLGLAITREIVEDTHGGSISFESEWGRGTTFHVGLPLVQPRKEAPLVPLPA